jgi:FMN phosphatase YigB (HAD superfamily)
MCACGERERDREKGEKEREREREKGKEREREREREREKGKRETENVSEIADDVMQAFLRERNNVVLFPGVLETLSLLSSRGIKLGAITNGNADMSKVMNKK